MANITLKTAEDIIQQYINKGGYITTIENGVLGLGKILCFGEGLKTSLITEYFINSWASGHKIRMYNKTPKKYEKYQ